MTFVFKAVGISFESYVSKLLPDLIHSSDIRSLDEKVLPDFRGKGFFIEAKAGNSDYGIRLKKYQVEGFSSLSDPVIYMIGYHNTKGLLSFLNRRSRRWLINYCMNTLEFPHVFFVSQSIIERLWEFENHTSKKKQEVYCVVKPRHFRNIIENKQFIRQNTVYSPEEYYHIKRDDFFLHQTEKRSFLLHQKSDWRVLQYLESNNIIRFP